MASKPVNKDLVDILKSAVLSSINEDRFEDRAKIILDHLDDNDYVIVKKSDVSVLSKSGNIYGN
jgi:hypothetical protein